MTSARRPKRTSLVHVPPQQYVIHPWTNVPCGRCRSSTAHCGAGGASPTLCGPCGAQESAPAHQPGLGTPRQAHQSGCTRGWEGPSDLVCTPCPQGSPAPVETDALGPQWPPRGSTRVWRAPGFPTRLDAATQEAHFPSPHPGCSVKSYPTQGQEEPGRGADRTLRGC